MSNPHRRYPTMFPLSDWSTERVRELVRLSSAGLTASEIAKALGGTTKCAVVGKLARMGVPLKRAKGPPRIRQIRKARVVRVRKPPVPYEPVDVKELAEAAVALRPGQCRWPYEHGFCGAVATVSYKDGEPPTYCNGHAYKAYRSTQDVRPAISDAERMRRKLQGKRLFSFISTRWNSGVVR